MDAALVRALLGMIAVGRKAARGEPGGQPTWLPAGEAALDRVLRSFG